MENEKDSQKRSTTRRIFLGKTGSAFAGFAMSAPLLGGESKPENAIVPPSGTDPTMQQMVRNLRRANQVAARAMEAGHHPFGAILVAADHETVMLEQGNIDVVNHAESTLARRAAEAYTEEERWTMTLYSTAEPCVMCAGTQYWANIGRLVYGMSERQLLDMTGNNSANPTLDVPSRYVFTRGQKHIRVWGPVEQVVEEIAALHKNFWR